MEGEEEKKSHLTEWEKASRLGRARRGRKPWKTLLFFSYSIDVRGAQEERPKFCSLIDRISQRKNCHFSQWSFFLSRRGTRASLSWTQSTQRQASALSDFSAAFVDLQETSPSLSRLPSGKIAGVAFRRNVDLVKRYHPDTQRGQRFSLKLESSGFLGPS